MFADIVKAFHDTYECQLQGRYDSDPRVIDRITRVISDEGAPNILTRKFDTPLLRL